MKAQPTAKQTLQDLVSLRTQEIERFKEELELFLSERDIILTCEVLRGASGIVGQIKIVDALGVII